MASSTTKKYTDLNEKLFLELDKVAGDEELQNQIKNDIISHNIKLVHHAIRKRFPNLSALKEYKITYEDLYSEGMYALFKAVNTFDITKGFKFATYAIMVINNELLMLYRKIKNNTSHVSMDSVVHEDAKGSKDLYLHEMLTDNFELDSEVVENEFESVFVQELKNHLSEREFLVLTKMATGECTQRALADEMGISQSYLSRIHTKAVKKAKMLYDIYTNK